MDDWAALDASRRGSLLGVVVLDTLWCCARKGRWREWKWVCGLGVGGGGGGLLIPCDKRWHVHMVGLWV